MAIDIQVTLYIYFERCKLCKNKTVNTSQCSLLQLDLISWYVYFRLETFHDWKQNCIEPNMQRVKFG